VAAFVGVRLVQGGDLNPESPFQNSIRMIVSDQLPSPIPDINGLFLRRQNNSILIGTGNIKFQSSRVNDGEPVFEKSFDGPEVELVVHHQTTIYCDVPPSPDQLPSSGQFEQRVELVTEDAIREDQLLWAWGEREGDRFIADAVLIFNRPYSPGCQE
jgi:hypothetical protein